MRGSRGRARHPTIGVVIAQLLVSEWTIRWRIWRYVVRSPPAWLLHER